MRVLHIVKTSIGATWALDQMAALRSLGVDVTVALPAEPVGLSPRYEQAGIKVVHADLDLNPTSLWQLPATLERCRRVVADVGPDLIHTHHVGPTFVVRLALGKESSIPRVFGVTGTLHLEHEFFAWLDLNLAGLKDHWIATCRWTQRKYEELGVPRDRVFLAYLGMETNNHSVQRTGKLRSLLRISPETPLVGMVSLIYPPKWYLGASRGHKGHEDFIFALAELRESRPDVHGVVIGGLWGNGQWYEDRVRYLGGRVCGSGITFLGTRNDISEIYPDLDLAVVPTHSDGVAFTVAEALLAEVPVIATNVGGLSDLIRDGETGWLVPVANPHILCAAMQQALHKRAEGLRRAKKGRDLTESLLNLESTSEAVHSAYERILGRSTKRAESRAAD